MSAIVVAAAFQNIEKAYEVCVGIIVRMFDRMPHAGLRRQMDDASKTMAGEELRDLCTVGKIGLHELEAVMTPQDVEARPLQRRIVIFIQVVEPDDTPRLAQQRAGNVKPDEARRTRHQYRPIRHQVPKRPSRPAVRPL